MSAGYCKGGFCICPTDLRFMENQSMPEISLVVRRFIYRAYADGFCFLSWHRWSACGGCGRIWNPLLHLHLTKSCIVPNENLPWNARLFYFRGFILLWGQSKNLNAVKMIRLCRRLIAQFAPTHRYINNTKRVADGGCQIIPAPHPTHPVPNILNHRNMPLFFYYAL